MASKPSSSPFLLCFLVIILEITGGADRTALAAPSGSLPYDPLHAGSSFSPVGRNPRDPGFECDKIHTLPGEPNNTDFNQYSGYVTVDQKAGRALFYYLVESPDNSAEKPLVLWLNGGPGCSSFLGAMVELGPFKVNRDGKTLSRNLHSWNNVANVIFVETPAGVGFSYSNTTSDYNSTGDRRTIDDTYTFLMNWFERFPNYKNREFFITGESYAGLYIPELAATILHNNKATNQNVINLKGIAMGNALVDYDDHSYYDTYEFWRNHAMISEETYAEVLKTCSNWSSGPQFAPGPCDRAVARAANESGWNIDQFNVYAPTCHRKSTVSMITSSDRIAKFDPCMEKYVMTYLNKPAVQDVMHANVTKLHYPWKKCRQYFPTWEGANTSLPTIKQLIISGSIRIWLYSGDLDSKIPTSATERAIKKLELSVVTNSWMPWYFKNEVGGYRVDYGGLTFVTIRGAGHLAPRDQPERALRMITSFLRNKLP